MRNWKYKPLQWIVGGIALMPFWMLYGLADITFVLTYHIIRYRRKVALKHIADSFPELTDKEHKKINRKFFRNFSDYIIETIKLAHISDKAMKKRMRFEGIEMIDSLMSDGKSIVAYFSHTFNWEWVPSITLWSQEKAEGKAEFCQIYRPLRNEWFDKYMLKLRGRFNSKSIPKATTLRELVMLRKSGIPSTTGFMSDQKPSHGDPTRVLNFLNHPTAFITGTETLARKLEMAVVFFELVKERRGHYVVKIHFITEDASTTEPMQLTDTYAALLEQCIKKDPSNWLWTHKRWKKPVNQPINQSTALNVTIR